MRCRYCGATNAEEEHRCQRCGRRLHLSQPRPAPDVYPFTHSSAAPEPYPIATAEPPHTSEPPDSSGGRRVPYQRSLFPREAGRVVPIHGQAPPTPRRPMVRRVEEARTSGATPAYQQTFDWSNPVSRRRAAQETTRYCDAPVAPVIHRAAAAVLDLSIVVMAVGLMIALVYLAMGSELVNPSTLPWFGAMATVFGLAYKLLWALAGVDSPGLRWVHLHTLNFDGLEPTGGERLARVAAGCLSLLAGGLGLLWATADEETLSWHDHMSKTFLTAFPKQRG